MVFPPSLTKTSILNGLTWLSKLLGLWKAELAAYGLVGEDIDKVVEGQPFHLHLMQGLLQMCGDADHKFLLEGADILEIGRCSLHEG